MSAITFFATADLERILGFYVETVGADVWLEQPDCTSLQYDSRLLGFCERDEGVLTFVSPDEEGVDGMHERLADRARERSHENETDDICRFFADDPDGQTGEFQSFLHPTDEI